MLIPQKPKKINKKLTKEEIDNLQFNYDMLKKLFTVSKVEKSFSEMRFVYLAHRIKNFIKSKSFNDEIKLILNELEEIIDDELDKADNIYNAKSMQYKEVENNSIVKNLYDIFRN